VEVEEDPLQAAAVELVGFEQALDIQLLLATHIQSQ
jgi:hypothetical protein